MFLLMARFEIDGLTEEELIELNQKIVARLRFLREVKSHVQMLDFRIGERVRFKPDGRPEVFGFITRYNRKSVSLIADNGGHWRVPPTLFSKGVAQDPGRAGRTAGLGVAVRTPAS